MSLLLSVLGGAGNLSLEGKSRTVQRLVLTAALTFVVTLTGTIREIERVNGATLTAKAAIQGSVREIERLQGQTLNFVALTVQRDKGSRRAKPPLPPEYRWPQPTPEQPEPLADVVVQAQIQGVALPKTPAIAIALRKAAMKTVKPTRQKEVKAVKKAVIEEAITDDDDDEDLFFLS